MPEQHAVLSASGSHRWLSCTPSALLESGMPDKGSPYAEEGTRAHALAEERLTMWLDKGKKKRKPKDIDGEMWEAVSDYVDICIEKINEARKASPDAVVYVEHRLDFSPWVPGGFGTGDMVIVSDEYIEVVDLKYGKGVRVSAENNSQMRLYALGAHNAFGLMYGYEKVRMTIVQPRLDAVSSEEIELGELLKFGELIVKPAAELAAKGEGEKKPGDHCKFCKYKMKCRELSEYMLDGVNTDFAKSELTDIELADICSRAGEIKKWLTEIEEYALGQALDGKVWPGLKLVAGMSRRKITDNDKAVQLLASAGYSAEVIYKPQELNGITALEKAVGKKELAALLGDIIDKPEGKPTLVLESDPRPELVTKKITDEFDDGLIPQL